MPPETFVGSLNRGRTTGVMLIPVSQAVRGPDGRLLGVVEASLSARAFADFYERLKPTPDAAFAIHTADGSIVVRLPLPEDEPPKGIQVGSPVFAMLQSAPSGTFIGASPVDGLERVGAYSKVEGYPLVVVASVTVESALAGWRQRTVRNAAFCLAALAVVTLLTRYGMARTRRELDAQDRLVMSEQRTWHVADAMPSMLFQADGEGRILWRNLWWHRYTGLPRGGTAAASAWEVVHPDDGERAQADWKRALRDRKPFVDELRYRRSDGRYRWHLMRVEPVSYHRGKVVEWLGVGVDIEEQKEVERAVTLARDAERKANAAKSRFLAAVSHDLRQPFQAMRLFYEVLGQARLDSRSSDSLRRMGDAMAAGEQLLDALLDIAMLEAGQVTVKPADIDLAALVGQVVAEAGPLAAAKGLRLTFVPAAAAPARSDPALLRRIVGNLIANAIRYTDSGGVLVGLRRRRGRLAIEVWDTGRGIPADQLDEVFEEFSQLHNPERDRTHGLGLGLAVVKRTATLLGHDVDVRSCLGKGSVFRVALDRLPEAA